MKKLWDGFWDLLPWASLIVFAIAYTLYFKSTDFVSATLMALALANTILLIASRK